MGPSAFPNQVHASYLKLKILPGDTLRFFSLFSTFAVSALCGSSILLAQGSFTAVPSFPLNNNPLVIERPARPNQPFSVVGQRGAILGQQDGTFELWLLPVKVLYGAHLTAQLNDYGVPIDLNSCASSIEVRPDHTTITYSHAAITVRQHMFIPRTEEPGMATAIVLFEVHSSRKAELTLSFSPSMERQWPAPNYGRPSGSWIPRGTGGAYSLETDKPEFFGMIAMPNATPGLLMPYQERPRTQPLAFHFHYDPGKDDDVFYPLLAAVSTDKSSGEPARLDLLDRLLAKAPHISELYRGTSQFYAHFFDDRLIATTPDARMNDALKWAEISIEQSRVATENGAALAAGWYTSGDSNRPGFGWFFGRDSLWTLYAVNSYGDFALSRSVMDFLIAHQRSDGKLIHEYSQTASEVDWDHMEYLYAAADTTPLFVMEMEDYVRASGDLAYLQKHWDNVKRAYAFTRAHTTNGVYDNTQGTGWVEEWKPGRPHQEIYLASLDQQSAESMSRLALLMQDQPLSAEAKGTSSSIAAKLSAYRLSDGAYAFSRNLDGSFDTTPTIFPAVAWWTGRLELSNPSATFESWSSSRFATDWGIRAVAADAPNYDPITYHIGSVWPLHTGWAIMAEYRTGRPLQAYANLFANAELTWLQDLGAITEVLSGEFDEPLGRSSSHQLWSSAMLFSPAIRGLFGVEADALHHTLRIAPQLPAEWSEASLDHVNVGDKQFHVAMNRVGRLLNVDVSSAQPETLCLTQTVADAACSEAPKLHHRISLRLPAIEVICPHEPAVEGSRTLSLKVIRHEASEHSVTLDLEAPAHTEQHLHLRQNEAVLHALTVTGATLRGDDIEVSFPDGPIGKYQRTTVEIRW